MLSVNSSSLSTSTSPGQSPMAGQAVGDEQGKKREIRLMKNRYNWCHSSVFVVINLVWNELLTLVHLLIPTSTTELLVASC